jgi:hypothetical protein
LDRVKAKVSVRDRVKDSVEDRVLVKDVARDWDAEPDEVGVWDSAEAIAVADGAETEDETSSTPRAKPPKNRRSKPKWIKSMNLSNQKRRTNLENRHHFYR